MRDAAVKAHDAGGKVSLTLSDSFCVARFRDEFLDLAEHHVDILFANEGEILSLYQVSHFDDAVKRVRSQCEIAVLTRSEKGSVVVSGSDIHLVEAEKGVTVIDTTGAGDAYAAGFLYAYTHDYDLSTCGKLGSVMAAEVIAHLGPRLAAADVKALAARVL
jgi:sugar/nucleoside kinase (ribokinase family)